MNKKLWYEKSLLSFNAFKEECNNSEFLVLGNGPSLDLLKNYNLVGYKIIACNNAWRSSSDWSHPADFFFFTDRFRALELLDAKDLPSGQIVVGDHDSVYPSMIKYRKLFEGGAISIKQKLIDYFDHRILISNLLVYNSKIFSRIVEKKYPCFDPRLGFNFGYSVIIPAIQFAVALGARKVILFGVDASSSNGAYFSAMPSDLRRDEEFLKNPRLTIEPSLAMLRAALDPMGIELLDASGGSLTSLDKCTL